MSTQPNTLEPMAAALEELHTLSIQFRENEGKPPKGTTSRKHWSHLVATVFTDPGCNVETVYQELSSLPSAVVANGIASSWEDMDEPRRTSYLSWLATLDTEKAARQKVVLIPALLDRFPSVSLELLCGLSLNQELKSRLAAAILGNASQKVGLMISPDVPEWKARKALEHLCQISDEPKVEMKARWEVLRLILKTIVERKMQKEALSQGLLQHVEGQLPKLASHFQELLRDLLKDLDPALLGRFFPSAATVSNSPMQEAAESAPPMVPPRATSTPRVSETMLTAEPSSPSNVLDRIAGWLDTLHGQVTLLTDTRTRILRLEQENQTVRAQFDAARFAEETARAAAGEATAAHQQAQHRLQVMEETYREGQKALNSSLAGIRELESELNAARERESQSGTKLRQRETEFVKEREDLQRLIQANADRRLQEFQNSIGGSLRKLLSRVPDRGAPVPSELGAVLLARLHEVIDELESKGIPARPEREAVSR